MRVCSLLWFAFGLIPAFGQTTPIVQWSFDGTIVSSSGHNGTATSISYVPGHDGIGQAASFNGTTSRVDYPANALWTFNHTQSFTVDFYLRTSQQPSVIATIIMTRNPGAPDWMFVLAGDAPSYTRIPRHLSLELWNYTSARINSLLPINDGAWHHVVAAYYAPQRRAVMFIDDEFQGDMKIASDYTGTTNALCFGNNIGANQPYGGELDDFQLFSGVPPQVPNLYGLDSLTRTLNTTQVEASYDAWVERLYAIKPIPATTLAEWQNRRQFVRAYVLKCLGLTPFPYTKNTRGDLLPLDPQLGPPRDQGDYTIQGILIQTWQDTYAYGWLYLPKTGTPPYPAILNVNGHFQYEGRDPVEQSRCIGLVKKGFIALEINSAHPEVLSDNITPISAMAWNGMRALDYLETRPDVDATRLGCTGASGGGQQTTYLMCLDDRLAAAVPAVYPCYMREIMMTASRTPRRANTHHFCNWVTGLLSRTDHPEMAAVFAPKPSLFISNEQDYTGRWPEEGMPEVSAIYGLHGATGEAHNLHTDAPHDYERARREPMYAFFLQEFMGITDATAAIEPDNLPILSQNEMVALLPTMATALSWNAGMAPEFAARLAPPALPAATNLAAALAQQAADRQRLAELLDLPVPDGFSPSITTVTSGMALGFNLRVLHIRTEPEMLVPAILLVPEAATPPYRLVVMAGDLGKGGLAQSELPLCRALVDRGVAVLLPDVRYTGELASNDVWFKPYGTHFGRFEAQVGSHDLRYLLAAVRQDAEFQPDGMVLIGFSGGGIPTLAAAALDTGVRGVAAIGLGPTYAQGRSRPYFNAVVTLGDLPGLVHLCASRPMFLAGATTAGVYDAVVGEASLFGVACHIATAPPAADRSDLLAWYDGIFATTTAKTLTIGDATAVAGSGFQLPVSLTGAQDETAFGFTFQYDPSRLEYMSVSAVQRLTEAWNQLQASEDVPGTVHVEAAAGAAAAINQDGVLLDLVFSARAGAAAGDTQVEPRAESFTGGLTDATAVAGMVHVVAPSPTPTPTATPLPTSSFDLNHDGRVDAADLLLLTAAFGETGGPADFNFDGRVDDLDVLMFSLHWEEPAGS